MDCRLDTLKTHALYNLLHYLNSSIPNFRNVER